MSTVFGYELFNDIEDEELRTRNRARVMFNIIEDNEKDGVLDFKSTVDLFDYMEAIPHKDRLHVLDKLKEIMGT